VTLAQLVELGDGARVDVLADPAGDALPDALDLRQLRRRQLRDVGAEAPHGTLRVLVGADPEGVGTALVELRQRRELAEEAGDLLVRARHGSSPSR
jgi:hypothetical protein